MKIVCGHSSTPRSFLPFLIVFVFLVVFGLYPRKAEAGFLSDVWKFIVGSGQTNVEMTSSAAIAMPLLGSQSVQSTGTGGGLITNESADPGLPVTQDSALVGSLNPAGILPPPASGQITVYTVAEGDTPSGIADKFGISLNTLLWANDIKNSRLIKAGDTLVILPVSGVKYEVKKGDTVSSIAKRFKPKGEEDFDSFVNDILSYNGLAIDEKLEIGMEVIIPDGETSFVVSAPPARIGSSPSRSSGLPEFIGYYLRPILGGRKTQGIHGYNGVDLANSCGLPVMATAPGKVIVSKSSGWNGGYALYAVISHPNNTQSLYSHMSKVFVSAGQNVNQGEVIGLIGSTGRSTGCHLHFEIRGAKNPF